MGSENTLRPENVGNIYDYNFPSDSNQIWRRITDYEVRTTISNEKGGDLVSSLLDIKQIVFVLTGTLVSAPSCKKTMNIRIQTEVNDYSIDFGSSLNDPSRGFWLQGTFLEDGDWKGAINEGPEIWYRLEKPSVAFSRQGAEMEELTSELLKVTDSIIHRELFPLVSYKDLHYSDLKNTTIFDLWEKSDRSFSLEFIERERYFILDQLETILFEDRSKEFTQSIKYLTLDKIASYLRKNPGDGHRKKSRMDDNCNASVGGSGYQRSESVSNMQPSLVSSYIPYSNASTTENKSKLTTGVVNSGRTVKLMPMTSVAAKSSSSKFTNRPTDINTLKVNSSRLLKNASSGSNNSAPSVTNRPISLSPVPTTAPPRPLQHGPLAHSSAAPPRVSCFESSGGSVNARENLPADIQRNLANVVDKLNNGVIKSGGDDIKQIGVNQNDSAASQISKPHSQASGTNISTGRPLSSNSIMSRDSGGKSGPSARKAKMETVYSDRFLLMKSLADEFYLQSIQDQENAPEGAANGTAVDEEVLTGLDLLTVSNTEANMDIDKVMPIEDASREKKNRGKNVHFRQDETLRQVRFFHTDDPVI